MGHTFGFDLLVTFIMDGTISNVVQFHQFNLLHFSIFGQIGEELGLVGCIESLKIESKDTSKEYDLMYPGSRDIIGGSGIGGYF